MGRVSRKMGEVPRDRGYDFETLIDEGVESSMAMKSKATCFYGAC